jgi:predicted metalloendopeptidase
VTDKKSSEEIVDFILQAYKDSLKNSEWMDEEAKAKTINHAIDMKKFIGYHEKMRGEEGYSFYNKIPFWKDNFMLTGLAFKTFSTDRDYIRRVPSVRQNGSLDDDWTK